MVFFFFNDTATTEIYTLSLHDALPIWAGEVREGIEVLREELGLVRPRALILLGSTPAKALIKKDRKSTRLNSSHANISYAVFCLKKKPSVTHPLLPLFHIHIPLLSPPH